MSLLKILEEGYANSVTAEDLPTIADEISRVIEMLEKLEANLQDSEKDYRYYAAVGLRHLNQGLYREALNCFAEAIKIMPENNNVGDVYFYAAICLFDGKRPFLTRLPTIRKIEQYLNIASEFGRKGIYDYLKYLIHSDFYENKKLRCSPPSHELLARAEKHNTSEEDKVQMRKWLGL